MFDANHGTLVLLPSNAIAHIVPGSAAQRISGMWGGCCPSARLLVWSMFLGFRLSVCLSHYARACERDWAFVTFYAAIV